MSSPAFGQVVRGRVLDLATDSTIPGVTLALLDSVGSALGQTVSADDGRFIVKAPLAGRYRLRAERIGYQTTTSAPFAVGSADTLQVELRISTEVIELAPLQIISAGRPLNPRLAAWGFYERQEFYRHRTAKFFTVDDLERLGPAKVTHLLRDIPELQLVRTGHRTDILTRRGRPVVIFIDGHKMPRGPHDPSLDDLLAAGSVGAVEVYWDWAPAQYGGGSAIVIWTGRY